MTDLNPPPTDREIEDAKVAIFWYMLGFLERAEPNVSMCAINRSKNEAIAMRDIDDMARIERHVIRMRQKKSAED